MENEKFAMVMAALSYIAMTVSAGGLRTAWLFGMVVWVLVFLAIVMANILDRRIDQDNVRKMFNIDSQGDND